MLSGVPCPRYIRSVKIFNNSSQPFEVTATFDSGKTTHTTINVGEKKLIEETIDHGSMTSVDPILTMNGHPAGQAHKQILHLIQADAQSIEKRYYEITPNLIAVQGPEPVEPVAVKVEEKVNMGNIFGDDDDFW